MNVSPRHLDETARRVQTITHGSEASLLLLTILSIGWTAETGS